MKISKITKQILYLIFVLSIISCASKKQVTAEDILVKEETKSIPKSKIIFLNYVLVKNAQDEKSI
ncbi:MAG: hypothetical protein KBT69_00590, partial [Oceanihabitans sp.]|nr:hypothetical protein [Oceanihabitans sp.]